MKSAPSKLRVLMISARADIGGGPRHMFDLASALRDDVALFCCCPNETPYADRFRSISNELFVIPKRRFSIVQALGLLWFCRKHQIQLVHSHGRGAGAYSRFLSLFGIKAIHTFHGFHVQRGLKQKLILLIEKLLVALTDSFIVVSAGERDRVIANGVSRAEDTHLIFNGIVDCEPLPCRSPSPHVVFGCLTRFDPQKGNDVLVNAIANLPQDVKERVLFRLVGEGPEMPEIRKRVDQLGLSRVVTLPGPTSDPEGFFREIDVYVSASRGEGLSYATLESLRAGRPLLLSRVTGHTELEGIEGVRFFDLENQREFEAGVMEIVEKRAVTHLPSQFSLQTMASKTLQLYRSLL